MNQDNNYNFDPMTGEPIKRESIQEQHVQQLNNTNNIQPEQSKKNNKIILIIIILIISCIIAVAIIYLNKYKSKENNTSTENNNISDNSSDINEKEDENIVYDKTGPFLFEIEDIFTVTGTGTLVTGNVERGTVKVGDTVQIIGLSDEIRTTTIISIQRYRKEIGSAEAGESAGLVLKDVLREDLKIGQVLAEPNSISATKKFEAEVHVLSSEEGGRYTPFFKNYRPNINFRDDTTTSCSIDLPDDIEVVYPGDNLSLIVNLNESIALEVGMEFFMTDSDFDITTVKGKITKIY